VDRGVREGTYGLIDRLVLLKDGYLVLNERYGQDYQEASRGASGPLGCGADACAAPEDVHPYNYLHPDVHPYPGGRDVHSLQSVTKSITSAALGAAIAQGMISGTEAPLLSFFQDYDLSGVDPRLGNATLDDLLTMRSGIEWHEQDRPLDETNTTLQLERSQDWIQFTLDQPMDAEPGQKWAYNSGGSHLMSGVVKQASGQFVDTFSEDYLFGPLGIEEYHWKKTPRGYPDTEGGLYLEAEDLAKIGWLFLNDGVWDGERILPEGWVAASTAIQVADVNPQGWGYGYQWWRLDREGTEIWAGLGFGGQFLLVMPQHDMVGVVNSWNLFGPPSAGILGAYIAAMMDAAG
jgi:CubicO group peptidase (beta-lactamase class C family)